MTTIVTIDMGGTGATHAAGAREALSVPSAEQLGHSYAQANSARDQANTAYGSANTAQTTAQNAYGQANNSRDQANTARTQANTAYDQANNSRDQANTAYGQANSARSDANTTFGTINTTFGTVNTTFGTINTSLGTINTNYQAAYAQANTARGTANDAYAAANTKLSSSGGSISGDLAITGNLTVSGNATTINVSNLSVNDSMILLSTNAVGDSNDIGFIGHFDRGPTATHAGLIRKAIENRFYLFDNYEVEPSNNVIDVAGNNFRVGNLRLGIINANSFVTSAGLDVTGQANAAYGQANDAYTRANTKLDSSGGTISGNLTVTGTLTVSGNVSSINTQSISSVSNEIILNSNASGAPTLDGKLTVNRGSSANVTLLWNETADKWGWTDNGTTYYYFDDIRAAYAAANNRVLKAGDTMTGQLNISSGGLLVTGDVGFGSSPAFTTGSGLEIQRATATATLRLDSSSFATELYGYTGGTGLFQLSAGYLDLGTNNTTRLRIDANGNVSIGTSSTTASLQVQGASGDAAPIFRISATAAASSFNWASSFLNSSLGSGRNFISLIGQAESTKNSGYIGFNHSGTSGSNSNFLTFGLFGVDNILNITGAANIGIGNTAPVAKLQVTQAAPSGAGAVPSGTTAVFENAGNNYITMRHSADGGFYSGMVFEDNNIGGYVIHGDGGSSDKLFIAGYGGVDIQYGSSSSVTPGARTTVGSFTSTGLAVTGNMSVSGYFTNIRGNGSVSAPSTSDHSLGTRITLYDATATSWYAIGIESDTMWFNSDNQYKWYVDAAQRMILDSSGNLTPSGKHYGNITSSGSGDSNAPFIFNADYSGWASHWAGTPGSNNGWGLFWAGNSGAQYGTNGTGGPGNIWSNSANPNEAVFVGNGSTDWTLQLNAGNVWQKGHFYCAGDVYTSYSDKRLKDIIGPITNAVEKVKKIDTIYYTANELAKSLGVQEKGVQVGVTSQSVKEVLPEVVVQSPVNIDYETVQYERIVPLLIAAIKEQQEQIEELKKKLGV